jgi:2-iminobutanoate/2-iminopropanoate deaminase
LNGKSGQLPINDSQYPKKPKYMSKQIIRSNAAPAPIGPYSQAVLHHNILYVSGQIALNPSTGELETDNISAETERVMQNLQAVLGEAGMDFSHVLKCSIFLSDMGNFAAVNEVYGKYFSAEPPARETVAVKTLPKSVNVEISCIAGK